MVYRFKNTFTFSKTEINGVTIDTSVLFGFIRSLRSNFYDNIFICLDGTPQRHLDILPSYKGQRQMEPNEATKVASSEIIMFLSKLGPLIGKQIHVVASPNQEADQVMSSLALLSVGKAPSNHKFFTKLCHNGFITLKTDPSFDRLDNGDLNLEIVPFDFESSVISSTDSDMYQLLHFPGIHIDSSTNGRKIVSKTPKAVKFLSPGCIPAYKMIVGDVSDNVPKIDIPISDKGLIELIKKYLYNPETIDLFVQEMRTGMLSDISPLRSIQKYILDHNLLQALIVNREITTLNYYSTPLKLTYPNYDIQETIQKYRLKV